MSWEDNLKIWEEYPNLDLDLKFKLNELKKDDKKAEEAFYAPMEFGTAGMRGLMGPGINAMNIYTVRQAASGLAGLMDTLDEDTKSRGVAISFDSRYNSQLFAVESAKVLGAHGIKSFLFDSLRPTPELSFAVRELNAYAGIMITASHNPKQYNGFKIYGEDGGQMPPKESDIITDYVRKNSDLFAIEVKDIEELRESGLVTLIGEDIDQIYLKNLATVTVDQNLVDQEGSDLRLVYSPLHGTGKVIAPRMFANQGFNEISMVDKQAILDPEFATVPFPNPEFTQAFDMAIAQGKDENADVLIATDPDADRLGAAVRLPSGDYQLMTGNQIASVLIEYILHSMKENNKLPENGAVIKSIVSTELATKIVKSYGLEMFDVLTGFKYIAEMIQDFEDTNSHEFLFGFEESYGYLVKGFVRDKDAMQASLLLAEVSAFYKSQGKTMYDGLLDLYNKYGYYQEKTLSEEFEGVDGKKIMADLMTNFREKGFSEIAGHKVVKTMDYQTRIAKTESGEEEIELPQADVLKYILDDETWIAIRPSGTEPKIKFYIGVTDSSEEASSNKLAEYVKEIGNWTK
ncbi:phosphoglucomutase [Companilactobacillus sp. RD055328]|uniref:phospho-sugar mutase n=1 Tax=Companilactobacillus sp. RD055328 TaxID=2916634 RepID=UPI001FC7EBF9|nr:phospho-sugar mutase [Companilactobacillus sp. RD055328]GKQ43043.1 phosphoglucomutase [Companilactobacillus sp. RD055328]